MKSVKRVLSRILHRLRIAGLNLTVPLWLPVFKFIAKTGVGTDRCIEQGFLPMRIHYYSPVPDIQDLDRRQVWNNRSDLVGVDFRPSEQLRMLRELGERFGDECDWPVDATQNPHDFYTANNSFSFGCAASLYSVIRYYRPGRVVEIGSGNSSLVISSAVSRNKQEGAACEYVIIDPYPAPVTATALPGLDQVIRERVELTDLQRFQTLRQNDILFIDSGHTVRTGGDVNFLFLEVLPRLAPGVVVHIHDINLPFEYPKKYFTNPSFRMFWTESYLLQAFLSFNSEFEVLLAMSYLMTDKKDEFSQAFKHYDPQKQAAISGSFWMRRKA